MPLLVLWIQADTAGDAASLSPAPCASRADRGDHDGPFLPTCALCAPTLPSGAPPEDARSLPDVAALAVKRLHAALRPTRRQRGRPLLAPDLPAQPRSRQRQPGSRRPPKTVRAWDRGRS